MEGSVSKADFVTLLFVIFLISFANFLNRWFTEPTCNYSGSVVHCQEVIYISGSVVYNLHMEVVNRMATEKARYTVSVEKDMFQQIENFRFENRYQTRSEATVELIRIGLESLKKGKKSKLQSEP